MDKNDSDRALTCVLFPGIVKDEERALQCLGGVRNISHVYSQSTKRRLGLSYQPENPFVKRIFADFIPASGVLLKVKVKKTKIGNVVNREVTATTLVGRVNYMYTFKSMCDFQYLPVEKEGVGPHQCILEKLVPSGTDSFNFLLEPAPRYIVPANFTRFDSPINYAYTDKKHHDKPTEDLDDDLHQRTRADRGLLITRYDFNLVDDLPTEPQECFMTQKNERLKYYPQLEEEFQTVQKMFEVRPIWSQNAIKFETKMRSTSLKMILPCLSIYMKNGPWRMLWVKFGYDPRKDPNARIYQTLDFRLRAYAGIRSMVMARDQLVHYKKADRVRHSGGKRKPDQSNTSEDVAEGAVYFKPGMTPTQRQIYYQYCDVKVPEVQEILAAEPPPGYLCHQVRGWLSPNTAHTCRDHIFRCVKQTMLATHSADLKFEQGSSDDGSSSDDGGTSTTATEVDDASNI